MDSVLHYKITVKGIVQGVFYRRTTLEKAEEIGVFGWVKNLKNGDVYIEAEATKEVLDVFLEYCHKGPEKAIVSSVEYEIGNLKNFEKFEIVR